MRRQGSMSLGRACFTLSAARCVLVLARRTSHALRCLRCLQMSLAHGVIRALPWAQAAVASMARLAAGLLICMHAWPSGQGLPDASKPPSVTSCRQGSMSRAGPAGHGSASSRVARLAAADTRLLGTARTSLLLLTLDAALLWRGGARLARVAIRAGLAAGLISGVLIGASVALERCRCAGRAVRAGWACFAGGAPRWHLGTAPQGRTGMSPAVCLDCMSLLRTACVSLNLLHTTSLQGTVCTHLQTANQRLQSSGPVDKDRNGTALGQGEAPPGRPELHGGGVGAE